MLFRSSKITYFKQALALRSCWGFADALHATAEVLEAFSNGDGSLTYDRHVEEVFAKLEIAQQQWSVQDLNLNTIATTQEANVYNEIIS